MCNREPSGQRRLTPRWRRRRVAQRGTTLVELMIGIAVGLMVLATALGSLTVSRAASAVVGDLGQLQSQAAFALRIIGQQVRQAGSVEPARDPVTRLYAFADTDSDAASGTVVVTGTDGGTPGFDTLTVSREDAPQTDRVRLDCLAESVRTDNRIESSFFVSNGELRCRTADKNQPLIGGVTDFQVRYRVRQADGGTQRLTATQVAAATRWPAVHAVEVCLELQGNEGGMPSGSTRDCEGRQAALGGRLRLVVHHVFDLRTQGER